MHSGNVGGKRLSKGTACSVTVAASPGPLAKKASISGWIGFGRG